MKVHKNDWNLQVTTIMIVVQSHLRDTMRKKYTASNRENTISIENVCQAYIYSLTISVGRTKFCTYNKFAHQFCSHFEPISDSVICNHSGPLPQNRNKDIANRMQTPKCGVSRMYRWINNFGILICSFLKSVLLIKMNKNNCK